MSYPLPDLDYEPTRGFWQGAARGELCIPRCSACRRLVWYPSERCPDCAASEMPWEALSGRGRLFSWAVVSRALFAAYREKAPYVTGLIALEEDPRVRVVALLADCEPDALQIDLAMRASFRPLSFEGVGSVPAPFFVPDRDPARD